MSLLNPNFYLIEAYGQTRLRSFDQSQPTTGLALLLDNFAKTHDIWYAMISTPESVTAYSFKELMGPKVYEQIVNKTAYVVLDLPFEPFYLCIDNIYKKLIIEDQIPASQIILMSNMYDAPEYNKQIAAKYNCQPIKTFYFSALEYMLKQYVKSQHTGLLAMVYPRPLKYKQYEKAFLNLNRRWRMHRPLLVLLLWYYKLLDKGFVSFGPAGDGDKDTWDYIWDGMKVNALDSPKLQLIIHESEAIKQLPPLYLDTNDLHINRPEQSRSTDHYYENSYFSVVSETTFYHKDNIQNSRFLTEKTYKAISMKHPFVLASIPKSLEVLHKLGYKTFSPFINESYDQEMNDNKRMLMVVDEINRLSNLSQEQLQHYIDGVVPICEYNYELLKNRTQFIYNEDWNAL
jgi:hypothetical protein